MKALVSALVLLLASVAVHADLPWLRHEVCMNEQEVKLYELITAHRLEHGLAEIPISLNLTWVAQVHALDLIENRPDQGECNMHSWSDRGPWSPCCYTNEHLLPHCMWDKPREFTSYQGRGYEIVFSYWPMVGNVPLAENAMQGWKGSPGHNNTILNRGVFAQATWNAIGIGIMEGYVVVWFGEEVDTEGPPPFCLVKQEERRQ